MTPSLLTQADLITKLREELGIRVGPMAIRKWIMEGLPTGPAPGSKPRFIWAHVRDWLMSQQEAATPLSQQIRDDLFRSSIKRRA